jgi:hypothetical protein
VTDPERALTDADVEAVASRVADLLVARGAIDRGLVDARGIAQLLGLDDTRWVREHAQELGGVRLGDGPKAHWRFDPVEAMKRVEGWRQERPAPRESRNVTEFPPVRPRQVRRRSA